MIGLHIHTRFVTPRLRGLELGGEEICDERARRRRRRAHELDALLQPVDDAVEVVAGRASVLELLGEVIGVRQQRRHIRSVLHFYDAT